MEGFFSKKTAFVGIMAIVLALFYVGSRPFLDNQRNAGDTVSRTARIGENEYMLEVADTDALRQKGLGGRASLCEKCGMLFVFDQPNRYAFWMEGMRFPLDIIWLFGDMVVFIARDVQPDFSGSIRPPVSADRVIEVNAGQAVYLNVEDRIQ